MVPAARTRPPWFTAVTPVTRLVFVSVNVPTLPLVTPPVPVRMLEMVGLQGMEQRYPRPLSGLSLL